MRPRRPPLAVLLALWAASAASDVSEPEGGRRGRLAFVSVGEPRFFTQGELWQDGRAARRNS